MSIIPAPSSTTNRRGETHIPAIQCRFPLFRYAAISHRPTASAADRAVLIEFRRFLAVIRATGTPPRQPIGARTYSDRRRRLMDDWAAYLSGGDSIS